MTAVEIVSLAITALAAGLGVGLAAKFSMLGRS